MSWNFENYIVTELLSLQKEMNLSNFNFEVETEQSFIKRKDYDEKTIYVIIKYLSDTKTSGATQQPVQLLILTEKNSLDVAKAIFDKFATDHNWKVVLDGTDYIKQQWTSPVVLSNFNPVSYGYRSVMYMTSNLYIVNNLIDFKKIMIGTETIEPINFTLSYNMQTNTQQTKTEEIASSVKSASSLSISMTIPMKASSTISRILNIISEEENGNSNFTVKLYTDLSVGALPAITKNMKLTSAQIATAVNQIPSIIIGLMK